MGIREWNERVMRAWADKHPRFARFRQRNRERLAALLARQDALAERAGYADRHAYRAARRARKAGVWWCVGCRRNVRPQPPAGVVRLATLGLLTPGKHECPVCRGVWFRAAQ